MYNPREDSYLLAQHAAQQSGDVAIDMCTGSGLIADALTKKFDTVIGVDVDEASIAYAKEHVDAEFIVSDGFDEVTVEADLITCNPPYLPDSGIDDKETESGEDGIHFSKQFIHDAQDYLKEDGSILLIVSTVASYEDFLEYAGSLGYAYTLVDTVDAFFEEIRLYEFRRR